MRSNRTSRTTARRVFATAFGAGCAALLASAVQAAEFQVEMNKSKALHLTQPAATVMVSNPVIADVTVEGSQLIYVMGRSYGRTNIIALDSDGKAFLDMNVNVVSQGAPMVTLMRGTGQYSYNCTPRCEPVANVGDDPASYQALMGQTAGMVGAGVGQSSGGDAGASGSEAPR